MQEINKKTVKNNLKEIVAVSNVIRKKYKSLKNKQSEFDTILQETYKPLTEPLKKIAENTENNDSADNVEKIKNNNDKNITVQKRKQQISNVDFELKTPKRKFKKLDFDNRTYSPPPPPPTLIKEEEVIAQKDIEQSPRSEIKALLNTPDGIEEYEYLKHQYGHTAADYLLHFATANDGETDPSYGIRKDYDSFKIGNFDVKIEHDTIYVLDEAYEGTRGLFELLFKRYPQPTLITNDDKQSYMNIVLKTNLHRLGNIPLGKLKGSTNWKYVNIIKPSISTIKRERSLSLSYAPKKKIGFGLIPTLNQFTDFKREFIYWDNPNELVARLRLILASKKAGHTNHDNEILSILEELREANIIE